MSASFAERMTNYLKAAFPCVAVQTTEEARALGDVLGVARKLGRAVVTWSATEGAKMVLPSVKEIEDTKDLLAACKLKFQDAIIVLRDPHTWPIERDPLLCRALRDLMALSPAQGTTVIILAHEFTPHPTFERLVTVMDYALPSSEDLRKISAAIAKSAQESPGGPKPEALKIDQDLLRALGGLSTIEAENALALSCIEAGKFDTSIVYREKVQSVRRGGLLEVVDPDPRGLDAIGGLDNLKQWVVKRRLAYSQEAVDYGLPYPKGILLVGVPGTGKSLSAKAAGTALGVPTLRLDIGNLFNSLVGASEARTRDALKLAEAMAPCVLWIDEIDKGFAGSMGSGAGDSGVGRRVFGAVISWMQERKRPVFLVATANQVENLPAEILRKGRFDEIFAVDLPTTAERAAILKIQLAKRGRDVKRFDIMKAAEAMELFTGSEIEAAVEEALFDAFDAKRELETGDIIAVTERTVPLAKTAKEQVNGIREWARTRARFASSQAGNVPIVEEGPRRRIVGVAALVEEEAPAAPAKGGGN